MNNIRATVLELWTKINPFSVSDDVYSNGYNDQYPKEILQAIRNSPNGMRAWTLFRKYVSGQGLEMNPDLDDLESLWDKVREMSSDLTSQGGYFIHRTVKIDTDTDSNQMFKTGVIKILDFNKCRISKYDDDGNEGKIRYGTFSYKTLDFFKKVNKNNTWYYPFSDNDEVIKSQIMRDAEGKDLDTLEDMINQFRGQVMYVNATASNDIYPISPFDSAFNDLDTDFRISTYANKMFRSGFLGKLMVLFSGLSEDDSKMLKKNVQNWLGAEKSDNVYVAEVESIEAIKDNFVVEQIPTQYDDNMSVNTEKRIKENIAGCASNAPHILLYPSDNSLFGGSGELLSKSMAFYNMQTKEYRMIIEKTLQRLGYNTKIIEL